MSQPPDESYEPSPVLPEQYSHATGKGDIYIAGAGAAAMTVLLVSLSILFMASALAFVLIRQRSASWPPAGFPALPRSLWLSTALILLASVTAHGALRAIRREDQGGLKRGLWLTLVVGVLFLVLQSYNWWEFLQRIRPPLQMEGAYLGMFYVLTGLHAAHVVGGLVPLAIVLWNAYRGKYSRNFHPGVRYCTLYWHFLDVVWVVLFVAIYF